MMILPDQWMAFRVIKKSIIDNVLKPNSFGNFRIMGYAPHAQGVEGLIEKKRAVSVYYKHGDFSKGSLTDPSHDMVFHIDLMAASLSKGDLLILEKEDFAEDVERQAYARALRETTDGSENVDLLIDDLINLVYQIIMHGENNELGVDRIVPQSPIVVSSRNIEMIVKDDPEVKAEFSFIQAHMKLVCRASELIGGTLINTAVELPEISLTIKPEINVDGS